MLDNLQFLGLIADVRTLTDLLGRLADSDLHFHRVVQQSDGQLPDLRRHSSREHHTLAGGRQLTYNLQDVLNESHIQHTVGLVKHKEAAAAQIQVAHLQMTEQPSWCRDQYVGPQTHAP